MADAEHVVGLDRAAAAQVGVEVRHHPPRLVVGAVRADVEPGADPVAVGDDDPGGQGVGQGQRRERGLHGVLRLGLPEQEQPDERAERPGVGRGAQRGHRFAAPEREVRLRAEQLHHAVGVVARGAERVAKSIDAVMGQVWNHVPDPHTTAGWRIRPRPPRSSGAGTPHGVGAGSCETVTSAVPVWQPSL